MPDTNNQELGTDSKKFKNLHLSNTANVGALNVTTDSVIGGDLHVLGSTEFDGQVNVGGVLSTKSTTIDGNVTLINSTNSSQKRTVDGVVISDLKAQFDILQQKVETLIPIGTIMMWTTDSAPDSNWRVCDGSPLTIADYPELYSKIQFLFGGSIISGVFNLPDLRHRVPVGKHTTSIGSSDSVAVGSRSLTHTHSGAAHTHELTPHSHSIPAHCHSIVSEKSTLKINSSGKHSTDYSHGHTGSTSEVDLTHTHPANHGHAGTANSVNIEHSHSINFTSGSTSPTIAIRARAEDTLATTDSSISAGVYSQYIACSDTGSGPNSAPLKLRYAFSPAHRHTIIGNTGNALCEHSHPVTIPTTTGLNTGDNTPDLKKHAHTVTINQTTLSSSGTNDGKHVHETGDFTGTIGDGSKPDGSLDNTLVSNNSASMQTGPSNYGTNTTGDHTQPHLVLNFIIKVKNF